MEFKKTLQKIMLENGISQKKLAEKTGIPASTIGNWFSRESLPTLDALERLSNYFECSIDYIVGRERDDGTIIISSPNLPEKKSNIQRIFDRLPPFYQNRVLGYAQGILESIGA